VRALSSAGGGGGGATTSAGVDGVFSPSPLKSSFREQWL